jgi:hypothetical protein
MTVFLERQSARELLPTICCRIPSQADFSTQQDIAFCRLNYRAGFCSLALFEGVQHLKQMVLACKLNKRTTPAYCANNGSNPEAQNGRILQHFATCILQDSAFIRDSALCWSLLNPTIAQYSVFHQVISDERKQNKFAVYRS